MSKQNKSNPRYRVYNSATKALFTCDDLSNTFDSSSRLFILAGLRNKGDSYRVPILGQKNYYEVTLLREHTD